MSAETNVYDQKMLKTIEVVKSNFASVRAGRANAGVLDRITVEYYGTPTWASTPKTTGVWSAWLSRS